MISTYGECNGDSERGKISIEVWNSIILSVANPLIEFQDGEILIVGQTTTQSKRASGSQLSIGMVYGKSYCVLVTLKLLYIYLFCVFLFLVTLTICVKSTYIGKYRQGYIIGIHTYMENQVYRQDRKQVNTYFVKHNLEFLRLRNNTCNVWYCNY